MRWTDSTKSKCHQYDEIVIDRTCLVALAPNEENARRSARNCDSVDTVRIDQMNAFEMLNHRFVVISKATLEAFLEGRASELALGTAKEAV